MTSPAWDGPLVAVLVLAAGFLALTTAVVRTSARGLRRWYRRRRYHNPASLWEP